MWMCLSSLPSGSLRFWFLWRVPAYIAPGVGTLARTCSLRRVSSSLIRYHNVKIIIIIFLKKRSTSRLLVLFLNGDVRHLQAITSAWRCQGPCGNDGVINSRLD